MRIMWSFTYNKHNPGYSSAVTELSSLLHSFAAASKKSASGKPLRSGAAGSLSLRRAMDSGEGNLRLKGDSSHSAEGTWATAHGGGTGISCTKAFQ